MAELSPALVNHPEPAREALYRPQGGKTSSAVGFRHLVLATLICCPFAACRQPSSHWTGSMQDSAGVTIVYNPDAGIWDDVDRWRVEEELRIGAVEGSPDYQFGDVWGVAVGLDGRIFVLDFLAQHIKVFSRDGEYEATIGRPGEGPGELRGAVSVLMGPGDTLLVQDNRALRFSRYAPDGSSVGGFPIEFTEGRPELFRTTASGELAEQYEPRVSRGEAVAGVPTGGIVRLAMDGSIIDTLLTFPSTTPRGTDGQPIRGAKYYVPEMAWDLADDLDLVCGRTDQYRIAVYSHRRLERIITKPFDQTPVSDSDKEVIKEHRYASWPAQAPRATLDRMWRSSYIADFYTAFHALAVGPDGTVWAQHVRRASDLREGDDPTETGAREWDVFDARGRFLGVVTMPPRFTVMVFQGEQIFGVSRDELDVPYVVRLRIVRGAGAGAASPT